MINFVQLQAIEWKKFLYKLSKEGIQIDFIDSRYNPYASLYFHNVSTSKTLFAQTKILDTPLQLEFAKSFVLGKLKNQKNYGSRI